MNDGIKVSIIVSTYNGESMLPKLMDTLLSQTLDSYEIILADDCSADNTRLLIDGYVKAHPDKVVANYMTANTRGSGTFNQSVKLARGKYLAFIDQDDWVDRTMYEKLYDSAEREKAEVAGCDVALVDSQESILKIETSNSADQVGDITVEKRKSLLVNPGWRLTKIFRKDFLIENNIYHCDNVCYGDNYFMEHVVAYCNKIAKVDEPLYFYRIDLSSITRSYNNPVSYDRVKSAELMVDSMTQRGFMEQFKEEIEYRFCELFYINSIDVFLRKFKPCELNELRYLRGVIKQKYRGYRKNKYFKSRVSTELKKLTLACDLSPLALCKTYEAYRFLKSKLLKA